MKILKKSSRLALTCMHAERSAWMKRLAAIMFIACWSAPAAAAVVTIYGAQILKVYAQSRSDSTAHLMQVDKTLDASCQWNRIYIELNDKEVFSSALANRMAGNLVDIVYETSAPDRLIAGHTYSSCRVVSIF